MKIVYAVAACLVLANCAPSGLSSNALPAEPSMAAPEAPASASRAPQDMLGGAPRWQGQGQGAQASRIGGQIQGKVRNAAGKAVTNATVLALNSGGDVVLSTLTARNGAFVLPAPPPGTYTIVVKNSYTTAAGVTVRASGNDAGAAPTRTITIVSSDEDLDLGTLID